MPLPTRTQAKLALKLLRQDMPMQHVINRLGGGFVEAEITEGITVMRIARNAAREPRGMDWSGSIVPTRYVIDIPAHVIADQQRRLLLQPSSITAARMGDPLPGCSAADIEPSITPSIRVSDPLDGLVFKRRKTGARYG